MSRKGLCCDENKTWLVRKVMRGVRVLDTLQEVASCTANVPDHLKEGSTMRGKDFLPPR